MVMRHVRTVIARVHGRNSGSGCMRFPACVFARHVEFHSVWQSNGYLAIFLRNAPAPATGLRKKLGSNVAENTKRSASDVCGCKRGSVPVLPREHRDSRTAKTRFPDPSTTHGERAQWCPFR